MTAETAKGLAKLREPFDPKAIAKLPKPYKRDSAKEKCGECGGYHGMPAAHLDYVGHAAITARLLDVDPLETFKKSKGAASDYKTMLANLPPEMQTNIQAIAEMSGGVKGFQGIITMGSDGLAKYKDVLGKVNGAVAAGGKEVYGFANQQKTLQGKLDDVKGAFSGFADMLGQKLLPVAKTVIDFLTKGLEWMSSHKDIVMAFGAVFGGLALGITAVTLATKLMSAAFWDSPIGMVTIAIAALAAGIIYAYNHSKTFRDIVTEVFHAVGAAGMWLWTNALKPAFAWITQAWDEMWPRMEAVFGSVWDFLKVSFAWLTEAWEEMWPRIQSAFESVWNFLQPAFTAIGHILGVALPAIFDILQVAWTVVWDVVKTVFMLAWDVLSPILGVIGHILGNVLPAAFDVLKFAWTVAWDVIGSTVTFVWNDIIQPVFGWINDRIGSVGSVLSAMSDVWSGLWHGIANTLRDIYDYSIGPVIDTIKGAIDTISSLLGGGGRSGGLAPNVAAVSSAANSAAASASQLAVLAGGTVPHNARGTDYWRGGLTWVGEEGPELVNLPTGAGVTPAGKSARMGGGAPTLHIENYNEANNPPSMVAAELAFRLRSA